MLFKSNLVTKENVKITFVWKKLSSFWAVREKQCFFDVARTSHYLNDENLYAMSSAFVGI